jgi:2-polyprenyl-3-methyl-5-hydroxy-6-metoxy-1,4-benzoquinol methylase
VAKRLTVLDAPARTERVAAIRRLLAGYPRGARLYGRLRFRFIPPSFLDAIEQHLPERGTVLDVGCGYGMFALYFAQRRPLCTVVATDVDERRIALARKAAAAQDIRNVQFTVEDLTKSAPTGSVRAAYCVDVLHHLSREAGDSLLSAVHACLEPNGVLILKDVSTRPRPLLYWAYVHDSIMYPGAPVCYRHAEVWRTLLRDVGFQPPHVYPIGNLTPYAHFLLVARKAARSDS